MAGHSTYHVNAINLEWEIMSTGGLPHLSALPHLPGVPRPQENKPLKLHPDLLNPSGNKTRAISSPGLFPQKMVGPHPFFEGKALGTRLKLGPLLFLVYINDLPNCLSANSQHRMSAEDTHLTCADKDI